MTKRYFKTMNKVESYADELIKEFMLPITEIEGMVKKINGQRYIIPQFKFGVVLNEEQKEIMQKEGFELKDISNHKIGLRPYTVATYRG